MIVVHVGSLLGSFVVVGSFVRLEAYLRTFVKFALRNMLVLVLEVV